MLLFFDMNQQLPAHSLFYLRRYREEATEPVEGLHLNATTRHITYEKQMFEVL